MHPRLKFLVVPSGKMHSSIYSNEEIISNLSVILITLVTMLFKVSSGHLALSVTSRAHQSSHTWESLCYLVLPYSIFSVLLTVFIDNWFRKSSDNLATNLEVIIKIQKERVIAPGIFRSFFFSLDKKNIDYWPRIIS